MIIWMHIMQTCNNFWFHSHLLFVIFYPHSRRYCCVLQTFAIRNAVKIKLDFEVCINYLSKEVSWVGRTLQVCRHSCITSNIITIKDVKSFLLRKTCKVMYLNSRLNIKTHSSCLALIKKKGLWKNCLRIHL